MSYSSSPLSSPPPSSGDETGDQHAVASSAPVAVPPPAPDTQQARDEPAPRKRTYSQSNLSTHSAEAAEDAEKPESPAPAAKASSSSRAARTRKAPESSAPAAQASSSSRATRTRTAPESSAAQASPPSKAHPARPRKTPRLLTSTKSRLANTEKLDLAKMLLDPEAWTSLTPEMQTKLRKLMPGDPNDQRPPHEFLAHNRAFQTDARRFQQDLAEGKYEPGWQRAAAAARKRREAGDYDDWKEEETEEFWGQKAQKAPESPLAKKSTSPDLLQSKDGADEKPVSETPIPSRPLRRLSGFANLKTGSASPEGLSSPNRPTFQARPDTGQSSSAARSILFIDLVAGNCFWIGDTFTYSKTVIPATTAVDKKPYTVTSFAKITAIDPQDWNVTFSIAGKYDFVTNSPFALAGQMLAEYHGRDMGGKVDFNKTAWRDFTVRGEKWSGETLAEIRELWVKQMKGEDEE